MVREMTEQLRQGRAVSWAGPVYLLPAGIQASGRVYPWGRIDLARTTVDGRQFHIHLQDTQEPMASLPTAAARFAAGRRVFETFASAAAATMAEQGPGPTLHRRPIAGLPEPPHPP